MAGIKGLQGVVRKTVNDELQAIIWEPQHMDKLIPSMLFNMQDSEDLDRYDTPKLPRARLKPKSPCRALFSRDSLFSALNMELERWQSLRQMFDFLK